LIIPDTPVKLFMVNDLTYTNGQLLIDP
jgi:hypothetical protein